MMKEIINDQRGIVISAAIGAALLGLTIAGAISATWGWITGGQIADTYIETAELLEETAETWENNDFVTTVNGEMVDAQTLQEIASELRRGNITSLGAHLIQAGFETEMAAYPMVVKGGLKNAPKIDQNRADWFLTGHDVGAFAMSQEIAIEGAVRGDQTEITPAEQEFLENEMGNANAGNIDAAILRAQAGAIAGAVGGVAKQLSDPQSSEQFKENNQTEADAAMAVLKDPTAVNLIKNFVPSWRKRSELKKQIQKQNQSGSGTNNDPDDSGNVPLLVPDWQCSDWSSCTGQTISGSNFIMGTQTRICEDINNTGSNQGMPATAQECCTYGGCVNAGYDACDAEYSASVNECVNAAQTACTDNCVASCPGNCRATYSTEELIASCIAQCTRSFCSTQCSAIRSTFRTECDKQYKPGLTKCKTTVDSICSQQCP